MCCHFKKKQSQHMMLKLLFYVWIYSLLLPFGEFSSIPPKQTGRAVKEGAILGGVEAQPHEFPYLVEIRRLRSIFSKFSVHACSGVIIRPQWVLTAAHCCHYRAYLYEIVAGEHDNSPLIKEKSQVKRRVRRIFSQTNYRRYLYDNDIALMKLGKPLEFNDFIQAIPLPANGTTFKGTGVVAGWGMYEDHKRGNTSNVLMKLNLPILSDKECVQMYGIDEPIYGTNLCAGYAEGGKDACVGNSGGGLFCKSNNSVTGAPILCGILSWARGCGRPNAPSIFTEVSHFTEWINTTITNYS